jgi:hypothetical protein
MEKRTPQPRDWDVKALIWKRQALGDNISAIQRHFALNAGKEGYPKYSPNRSTISKICDDLFTLLPELINELPTEVQAYVREKCPDLKKGVETSKQSGNSKQYTKGRIITPLQDNIEDKLLHDKRIFKESDKILSEEQIRIICYSLDNNFFQTSDLFRLERFIDYFDLEKHKYLTPVLKKKCEKLCTALSDLLPIITHTFIDYGRYLTEDPKDLSLQVMKIGIALLDGIELNMGTVGRDYVYKRLDKAVKNITISYSKYRKSAKEILVV